MSDWQELNVDEKRVHGSDAKKGYVWWGILLFVSSRLPDKVLLHLLIVILTSMLRIMKLKLREGRRLGKISSSMFDREEGASRQGLFLKDLRNQRRWTQSHISFNLPVLYLSSWFWNLSGGTNCSWGRKKVKVTAGWSQALSGQGQPWPPRVVTTKIWILVIIDIDHFRPDEVCLERR